MSSEVRFELREHGFWRQKDPKPFNYDTKYKAAQQTTPEMVHLRMGFLMSVFRPEALANMRAVDIGSGNGAFVKTAGRAFGALKPYDLAGESITRKELEDTEWDLICLTDVLEHMWDIEDLFKLKWHYCYISIPETPPLHSWEDLKGWRHYKPDEHVWMLNERGLCTWLQRRGCGIMRVGNPEDIIRRPPQGLSRNIASVIAVDLKRTLYDRIQKN